MDRALVRAEGTHRLERLPAVANIASSSRVTIAYMLPEYTDVLIFTWFWRTITVSRSLRLLW